MQKISVNQQRTSHFFPSVFTSLFAENIEDLSVQLKWQKIRIFDLVDHKKLVRICTWFTNPFSNNLYSSTDFRK